MHTTSANRFQSKPAGPAKLFLVPPPAARANSGSSFRLSFRVPSISRDQVITAAIALTTFWAAHLLLEHVFHI